MCPKCQEGEQTFEEASMGSVYICTHGGGRLVLTMEDASMGSVYICTHGGGRLVLTMEDASMGSVYICTHGGGRLVLTFEEAFMGSVYIYKLNSLFQLVAKVFGFHSMFWTYS